MQHPVGYEIADGPRRDDEHLGRARPTRRPSTPSATRSLAALATAGMVILGVSAYHLLRGNDVDALPRDRPRSPSPSSSSARSSTATVGHFQAQLMTDAAADEDGRRRGALREPVRRAASRCSRSAPFEATPERLTRQRRDPQGPVDARDQHAQRARRGHQRPPGRVRGEVRPRRLPAGHRRHLLVLPADGRDGDADDPDRRASACWLVRRGTLHDLAALPEGGALGDPRARSSATRWAGSSPRWAASRGSSRACC